MPNSQQYFSANTGDIDLLLVDRDPSFERSPVAPRSYGAMTPLQLDHVDIDMENTADVNTWGGTIKIRLNSTDIDYAGNGMLIAEWDSVTEAASVDFSVSKWFGYAFWEYIEIVTGPEEFVKIYSDVEYDRTMKEESIENRTAIAHLAWGNKTKQERKDACTSGKFKAFCPVTMPWGEISHHFLPLFAIGQPLELRVKLRSLGSCFTCESGTPAVTFSNLNFKFRLDGFNITPSEKKLRAEQFNDQDGIVFPFIEYQHHRDEALLSAMANGAETKLDLSNSAGPIYTHWLKFRETASTTGAYSDDRYRYLNPGDYTSIRFVVNGHDEMIRPLTWGYKRWSDVLKQHTGMPGDNIIELTFTPDTEESVDAAGSLNHSYLNKPQICITPSSEVDGGEIAGSATVLWSVTSFTRRFYRFKVGRLRRLFV